MLNNQVRATLLATTAVLTLIAGANAAPNVVLNPDFETGVLGPWSASCLGSPNGSCTVNAGVGNPGFGFQGFNNSVTPGTLSQTLVTAPGIYQVKFDHRTDDVLQNTLSAKLGASNAIVAPLATTYGTTTAYVATGLANTPLTFQYKTVSGSGITNVDNVSVVMVDDGQGNNIAAAAQTVAVQASRDFLDRLQDRFGHAGSPIAMASVRDTVLASNGGTYVNAGGKYRAFMSVFGSNGDWDDSRASANRRGLSAGFEFAAAQGLDLGIAFALSRTNFDTHTVFTANSGEAHEYLGAIYGHWSPGSMPLYVNLMGGYGKSSNDFERISFLGLGAAGAEDVKSTQWFGSAELGYDWAVSQKFTLTPFARVDTASVDQKGYSEVASGLFIPAVVSGRNFDATRTVLGAKAEVGLDVGRRGLTLGGKVGWDHEFDRDRLVKFSETTGPVTFTGVGRAARPDKDSVVAGAHAELPVSDDSSLYVGYNGNYGSNEKVHAGEVGLRVTW